MPANHIPIETAANATTSGRELLATLDAIGDNYARLKRIFAAMVQQTDDEPGSLTTRTDNTTGVITTTAALHGAVVGEKLDLTWSGGARTDVVVSAITANTITFSGGAGTNLPVQGTAITAVKHYKTVQNVFGFKTEDGAQLSFNEINSFMGNGGPSLEQCCARHKQ